MTEVIIENLVAAASKLKGISGSLEGHDFKETNAGERSFGHVELSEWFIATCEVNDESGEHLHNNAEALATKLNRAAELYRETDYAVAGRPARDRQVG